MIEEEAVQALRQNGVKVENLIVRVPKQGIGLRLWKYIDYLKTNHKYDVVKQNGDS